MKIKVLSFLLLVALTTPSFSVERASSPPSREISPDDADAIAEASRQALTTLSGVFKAKQSEALKVSDTALVAIDSLNRQLLTIKQYLDKRQTTPLEDQLEKDAVEEARARRDRMQKAILDLLQIISEMEANLGSSEVISQVAKSFEQARTLVNLINQNDRPALSTQLQKNVAVTNLSIVDVRSDVGATLKFSVGPIINCLSVKTTCDGKTHSVTLNPTLIVPKSELGTVLELAVSKVRIVEKLLIELKEELKEMSEEYSRRLQAIADMNQQAMDLLTQLVKLVAASRALATREGN